MNIRERLGALQHRIDELSLRERGILFLVVAALLVALVNSLLIAPQEAQQRQLLRTLATVRGEIAQLEQQKLDVIRLNGTDPDAAERAQLAQLQQATLEVEQRIKGAIEGLIEPQEMARALEGVLREQRQLSFVRVSNLEPRPLVPTTAEGEAQEAGAYIHSMRIELEGSFIHTRDYLQALEALPWRLHWESVELEMMEYPTARVVITVDTLSLSEGWIGV